LAQTQSTNNLLGILWMLVHAVTHSGIVIIAKHLQKTMSVFQILFIAYAMALIIMAIYFMVRGRRRLRTSGLNYQLMRTALGVFASVAFFTSLNSLTLAAATSISYLIPIAVAILSVLIFKEKLTKVKLACLLFGMLGVLIITRPDNQEFTSGSALVLLAVLLWSLGSILLKKLGTKVNNASQLFFTYFFGIIILLPFAISNWQQVPATAFPLMFAISILTISQFTGLFRAFKYGELTVVMPFDYMRLPINILLGFAIFQETVDINVILGSLLIIAVTFYFIIHNKRSARYVQ
jgi:drug/metabolite transporter (DMT)-like permease